MVGLISLAFLVGIISALMGVGGGFVVVPALTMIYGIDPKNAVGTSSLMIVFTAISSTIAYAMQRRIDYRVGALMTLGTVPGGILGAYATNFVKSKELAALFGIFEIAIAIRMAMDPKGIAKGERAADGKWVWERVLVDSKGELFRYRANIPPALAMSFLGGFASGFFGIGGGAVMVPVMVLVARIPMHLAVADSMFMMIFTSISAATTHLFLGNVLLEYSLLLAIGIIGGTQIGARIARRLRAKWLRRAFGLFLAIVGARMVLSYLP
ncbi:MAG: sulfite exporter TauE/SafE family protein [Candidatus Bathyarchaeia archaeon]